MSNLKIIYEDKDILAIDKPAGLMAHSDGRTKEKTLADLVAEDYPEIKDVGEPQGGVIRPGIVHRLDKDTSGVILIAKNQEAYLFLKNLFQGREIKKTYEAIVWGDVKNEKGIIDAPIARSGSDFRKWSASRGKRGKEREAVTEYKVIKRFEAPTCENSSSCALPGVPGGTLGDKNFHKFTLLELKPKTGRTHQIRVHMKFLNHPVICDKLYAPSLPCPVLGMDRLALHAKSIEFTLPSGKDIKIESPLPDDIKQAISLTNL